jgi:hypothetical protein
MLRLRYRPHGDLRQRLSRAGRHQVPRLRECSGMSLDAQHGYAAKTLDPPLVHDRLMGAIGPIKDSLAI